MNLKEKILRFFLRIFYNRKFKFEVNCTDFDPLRHDPYFLVGNHPCLHDGLFTAIHLDQYPYAVINAFLFVNRGMRFLLKRVIRSIPKRKGQSDIITIREIMRVVKKGKGIMLFPEGNSSFFGEGSVMPYSTVKLLKKMKLDIIINKTNGAYLSAARWGNKSIKKGLLEINLQRLYKGEELEHMTLDEIYEGVSNAIKFNDFEWNKKRLHDYNPTSRAEGLEHYIYFCPKCRSAQTIHTQGNKIFCDNCGEIGHFNKYVLLEGLPFDNLIDWGKMQKENLPQIVNNKITSSGKFSKVDMIKYKSKLIGMVDMLIWEDKLFIFSDKVDLTFDVKQMDGLVLTRKNELSFDYYKDTYLMKLKDPMIFYDAIQYLKGGRN